MAGTFFSPLQSWFWILVANVVFCSIFNRTTSSHDKITKETITAKDLSRHTARAPASAGLRQALPLTRRPPAGPGQATSAAPPWRPLIGCRSSGRRCSRRTRKYTQTDRLESSLYHTNLPWNRFLNSYFAYFQCIFSIAMPSLVSLWFYRIAKTK